MTPVWARWKRLAHRAAEIQANVLFLLLYFVGIVPLHVLRFAGSGREARSAAGQGPHWVTRTPTTCDLQWARRQF